MANADAAFGFRPINRAGSPYNGATERCVIVAANTVATFIGDAVKMDATTGVTSSEGAITVVQAAAGDPVYGVIVSFEPERDDLSVAYRPTAAQTNDRYVAVAPVNDGYFLCQDNGTLTAASAGLNANFIVGTGSTITGMSAMEVDSGTEATTTTLDLQLVAPAFAPDNDATLANANWIVRFNDPQTKPFRLGVA